MRSSANRERLRITARGAVFTAVVHAADGIRHAVAAGSRAELVRRLADYVRRRAALVLRVEHARYVRDLLARGELEAAVEVYFGLVGERWDKEWLVTTAVASDDAGGGTRAGMGTVAVPFRREEAQSRDASRDRR